MYFEVLTSFLHFALLLGLRAVVRELCLSEFFSLEVFNCNARYPTYDVKKKAQIVNAVFRFTAFLLCVSFYIVQTAVCCLVYGVVSGNNVRFVLVEMVLVELVCLCGQHFTFRISAFKRACLQIRTNWKSSLRTLTTETLLLSDMVSFLKCKQVWAYTGLYFIFSSVRYDTPSVVHCAFIHACYLGTAYSIRFVAALGMLGLHAELTAWMLELVTSFVHAMKLTNRVLQALLVTKLTLSRSFNLLYLVYVGLLPFTLEFVHFK